MHYLKNLIKEPTCFKNPEKPTIIDLILTNNLKLSSEVDDPSKFTLKDFQNVYLASLNSFAPLKKKYVKANQASFMNIELKKAIMIRSKLRNKFLKSRSEEDRKTTNREICALSCLKKQKRNYFSNLNTKRAVDNKKFWKTVKSSFFDKSNNFESITLVQNDSIVSNDNEVANIFNEYFSNLVEGLNLHAPENLVNHYCKGEDPISSTILKYQNHPSITATKKIHLLNIFSFKNASISDIKKGSQNLYTSKATQKSDLPTKIIKENFDMLAPFLFGSVNSFIDWSNFPKNLKFAPAYPTSI